MYIDKLDDIVNEYNNTYHRTIKMKPVDFKDNTYIDFNKEVNDKDPKFKVDDHVIISKYKNIFAKGYTPNWSKVFVIKEVKNTVPWTYVISDLKSELWIVNCELLVILKVTCWNVLWKRTAKSKSARI